jgi:hypothetical protein
MNAFANPWVKRGVVVLVGLFVLALKQYAAAGAFDLQALAGELASQLDKLIVAGGVGWLVADKPSFMHPSEPPELDS